VSEDNILNLEEDPSPSNDSLRGELLNPASERRSEEALEPADNPVPSSAITPASNTAGLVGELAEVVGTLVHGKVFLLQAGLQTLNESLRRLDQQLTELTSTPATASELDSLRTLMQRGIDEKTNEMESLFDQRLETARQSWSKEMDELL